MTPTRTTARTERQTAADAAGGRGSGGVFRIILVGATGLESSIAACGGVETVRVETPFEAIGEAADAALSGLKGRTAVIVGPGANPSDLGDEMVRALRHADSRVRVLRVGEGEDAAYDGSLRSDAGADEIMLLLPGIRAGSDSADSSGETPIFASGGSAADAPEVQAGAVVVDAAADAGLDDPMPVVDTRRAAQSFAGLAGPALPSVDTGAQGDEPLVERLAAGGDPTDLAVEMIRARMKRDDVVLLGTDATASAWDGRVWVPVLVGETHAGTLLLGRSDDRSADATVLTEALRVQAAWLGSWMTLSRRYHGLRRAALTDPLTGAWNRRYFKRFLSAAMERARVDRLTVTLLMFDIDSFKSYNDRYGHAAGDEILVETVRALESVIRPTDRVCRVGGDEFAVVFFEPDGPRSQGSRPPESVYVLSKRVQQAINQHKFPKLGSDAAGSLTISGGLATFPWDGHDVVSLMDRADELAMRSKRAGKNAITLGPGAERACRGDR